MTEKFKSAFLFGLSATVGALVVGWAVNRDNIQELQTAQIQQFINAGPRFTAHDGEALCERVRALELTSHGYRDAGKTPLLCEYGNRE